MKHIVEMLYEAARNSMHTALTLISDTLYYKAAREIERLQNEVDKLKKRLGPLPKLPKGYSWNEDGSVTKTGEVS